MIFQIGALLAIPYHFCVPELISRNLLDTQTILECITECQPHIRYATRQFLAVLL